MRLDLQINALLAVCVLLTAGACITAAETTTVFERVESSTFVDADARRHLDELRAAALAVDSALIVRDRGVAAAVAAPAGSKKQKVGTVRRLGAEVSLANVSPRETRGKNVTVAGGTIRVDASGSYAWNTVVESPGAGALRLRFTGFFLPRNAELYLYSDQGDAFGPYTSRGIHGDGEFWSHTLRGSRVTLHLEYDGSDTKRALAATRFAIADVGHVDAPLPSPQASNLCSFNADCIENASAAAIPASIQPAQDAVAMINFISGAWIYTCSGGLLADTDPGSDRPLFLTANHCLSKSSEARSLEAYFQFVTAVGGSCELDAPRVLGSKILATGRTGDFTLLELDQQPPAGSVMLGWSATPVAFTNGSGLFRVSHPAGAPQAYSEHQVDTGRPTCSRWPRGERIYSTDTLGGTQGGSSGAPVMIATGQVVGQLSGACGFNVGDPCDDVSNATVDGALAAYFPAVAAFLAPSAPCTDADGDGFCAGEDCDDTDPSVSPAAAENCGDGIDNDCDGQIDAADAECQTGSCDLLPVGDFCEADAQCCSGKCRGKSGSKSCR
jgi:hypothetical protein